MSINQIITSPEGCRLEVKSQMPENSDLAKTIVAFANDAGGDVFIEYLTTLVRLLELTKIKFIAVDEIEIL